MGQAQRANIVDLPAFDPQAIPQQAVPEMAAPVPPMPETETSVTEMSAAAEPGLPSAEPAPRISLTKLFAIRITREQIVAMLLGCLSISLLFLFWYVGTRYKLEFYIRFKNVPTPYEVFQQASQIVFSHKFLVNIAYSLRRILLGFFIAIAIGVPLGLMIGKYRRVSELFMPVIEILRPIPAIAWVPMSIMLWPNNEASIVYITFIGAFFPILLNTVHGVHSLDGVLIRAGRCLGAGEARLLWNVILPGSLPHIFTGLAVGMGVAWVSLIAAEMISGQFGVGYYTWEAYSLVNYPAIVLGMITIGVLGLACSGIIRMFGLLLMPWLAFAPGAKR
jgi:NitT/TauT family transport system permease protein